ncbi:hypothetical protein [Peribacillus frigoritolerans]|uniref:hypothetical protein n=1 Tax=Peribacillus frigoritolerans TaxID=450367 RepID=UPI0039A1EEA0
MLMFVLLKECTKLLLKRYKKYHYPIIIAFSIPLLIVIPYLVNKLMGFNVTKVYGGTDTWIGFLGSYIGSIISGLVTLLGVLFSIEFTKSQTMKDKLPEKIENLEECIDFIGGILDRLSVLERIDVSEVSRPAHSRTTKLYELDPNFNLINKKNTNFDEYIIASEKTIRKHLIKVNAKAYTSYRTFHWSLQRNLSDNIKPILRKSERFQSTIMDVYMKTDANEIINGYLCGIDLKDEHRTMLESIITDLYNSEPAYLSALKKTYMDLSIDLDSILKDLTRQLDY